MGRGVSARRVLSPVKSQIFAFVAGLFFFFSPPAPKALFCKHVGFFSLSLISLSLHNIQGVFLFKSAFSPDMGISAKNKQVHRKQVTDLSDAV